MIILPESEQLKGLLLAMNPSVSWGEGQLVEEISKFGGEKFCKEGLAIALLAAAQAALQKTFGRSIRMTSLHGRALIGYLPKCIAAMFPGEEDRQAICAEIFKLVPLLS